LFVSSDTHVLAATQIHVVRKARSFGSPIPGTSSQVPSSQSPIATIKLVHQRQERAQRFSERIVEPYGVRGRW